MLVVLRLLWYVLLAFVSRLLVSVVTHSLAHHPDQVYNRVNGRLISGNCGDARCLLSKGGEVQV